jgi:tetrahydromethanopterin S-methyltransferase subunit G
MPTDVTRDEFQQFEGRVTIVEREVEGEKMVTRHILEQTRRNSDDLAAIKTRLDRIERKVDGLEQKFDGLEGKVGGLDRKVDGMAKSLPTIIADVMREVLRERDGHP